MTEATRRIIPFDADAMDPPELLTVAQAAKRAETTGQTIRDWMKKGLPSRTERRRTGRGRLEVIYIDAEDLRDFRRTYNR